MILVTGGTGFLGSHLLWLIYKKNIKARVLTRTGSSKKQLHAIYGFYYPDDLNSEPYVGFVNHFEWVNADITEFDSLKDVMEDIDEIFHVAAYISYDKQGKNNLINVNFRGTQNLVNLALDRGISKFHYVSSIGALERNEFNIINESLRQPGKNSSVYSMTKYLAELEVWRGYQEGLKGVIVNPGVIIGPGEISAPSLQILNIILKGLRFFPSGSNGYVDVRDVASCLLELAEKEELYNERFLLVSESVTYKNLFEWIALGFGIKAPKYKARKSLAYMVSAVDWIRSLITGRKRSISPGLVRLSAKSYEFDNFKIKHAINYKFRDISLSVKESCEFIIKQMDKPTEANHHN